MKNAQEITKSNREAVRMLNGYEIRSLNYEGVVAVEKKVRRHLLGAEFDEVVYQVWMDGEVIDTLDTNAKIERLWNEMVFDELA